MKTEKKYGAAPVDLGLVNINPTEMMFWLYCPIKVPRGPIDMPENLLGFFPLVNRVLSDCGIKELNMSFIYLTAKTLWVTGENMGNRPGWHSDGFMSDDLNYIWYDRAPTIFYESRVRHSFDADHRSSLAQMDQLCESNPGAHVMYPEKHLLKLDERVLHRTNTDVQAGMRTFVKISVSKHIYSQEGNSINWGIGPLGVYEPRKSERNDPITKAASYEELR